MMKRNIYIAINMVLMIMILFFFEPLFKALKRETETNGTTESV